MVNNINCTIGVDFDNTLIDYDEVMYQVALEQNLIPVNLKKSKIEIRNYIKTLSDGELKWRQLQAVVYGEKIKEAKLQEGVKEFFIFCKTKNISLFIVSHKTVYSNLYNQGNSLRDAALDWMEQQHFFDDGSFFSKEKVFFEPTREEKIAKIKALGCTHFIDDLEEVFSSQYFPKEITGILYDPHKSYQLYQSHQSPEPFVVFENWGKITNYFTSLQEKDKISKITNENKEELHSTISCLLNKEVTAIGQINDGRNSKVYKVTCSDASCYAVKAYFNRDSNKKDCLKTEFLSLSILQEKGIESIPKPIAIDLDKGLAVYQFLEGRKILPSETTSSDINIVSRFIFDLYALKNKIGDVIPPAADACFSIQAIIENINQRLERLNNSPNKTPVEQECHRFLQNEFKLSFEKILSWCKLYTNQLGLSFTDEIKQGDRVLSPSDFGFHNALRQEDGKIFFLDFEYFGWDDPAKTIADFLLHPAMKLDDNLKQQFVQNTLLGLKENKHLAHRLGAVYPLFGLKWCTILLNEFIPEYFSRREFSCAKSINKEELQQEQLLKAKELLLKINKEYKHFPYVIKSAEIISTNSLSLDYRSKQLRRKIIEMVEKSSKRGHIPSAFSSIEILRVLFDNVLQYNPKNPKWGQRDRFILSKGHGCLALYILLAEKGFFPEEELWNFCLRDGMLGGHPTHKTPGIEVSTGSLGHGLPIGIGFALNAKYEKANYRTFVVIGDGEADEGSIWEAAMCAGKHKLSNLVVVVDYNKHQSYGSTREVQDLEPFADKWKSFGFAVREVDGHNLEELNKVFSDLPIEQDKPNVIICHTIKGKGVDFLENNLTWHHKSNISDEEFERLYACLNNYPRESM